MKYILIILSLLTVVLTGCTSDPTATESVATILDDWEEQIPMSQDDIDAYYRPLPKDQVDLHVSSFVWPSIDAYSEIQVLCRSAGKQPVIEALSAEFLANGYPRRNRAIQLLEQIDDRDWGQYFYPTPSFDEWLKQEGLE